MGSLTQRRWPLRTSNAAASGLPPLLSPTWTRPPTTVTANVPDVSAPCDVQTRPPVARLRAWMWPPVLMNTQPPATIGGGDWYPLFWATLPRLHAGVSFETLPALIRSSAG